MSKCYVKLSVAHNLKTTKTKKTDVIKTEEDELAFNQSFHFKAEFEALKDMAVTLQLVEPTKLLDKGRLLFTLLHINSIQVIGVARLSKIIF